MQFVFDQKIHIVSERKNLWHQCYFC